MGNLTDYFPGVTVFPVYRPALMEYDGSSYYTISSVTMAAGDRFTCVGRFKRSQFTGGDTETIMRAVNGTRSRGAVYLNPSDHATTTRRNTVRIFVQNGSGTVLADLYSDDSWLDGEEHSFLAAYDGTAGVATFIIDGSDAIDATNAEHVAPTTGTIGTTGIEFNVGRATTTLLRYGGIAGFIGYDDQYLTNYSDFFDSNNNPIKQDETSWANTGWGSQPLFWNENGDMANNKGSAGDLTRTGTILVADMPEIVASDYGYTA